MTVGLKLGNITDEIGGQDFFHAFFSTISHRLEVDGWGSRFPCLLNKFYQGSLEQADAIQALQELNQITLELSRLPPEKIVWDIENLAVQPPWGDNISDDITDLSNYFITSTGHNLITTLKECLEELRDKGGSLYIISI